MAYDFLEHLPVSVHYPDASSTPVRWQVHRPRIFLLGEVHRILKPGGEFFSHTPVDLPEWAQDPTHETPPWVEQTWSYFCGPGYPHLKDTIGFRFELMQMARSGPWLDVLVRKPKAPGAD